MRLRIGRTSGRKKLSGVDVYSRRLRREKNSKNAGLKSDISYITCMIT